MGTTWGRKYILYSYMEPLGKWMLDEIKGSHDTKACSTLGLGIGRWNCSSGFRA